jgi:hypothetical protein
VGKEKE